MYLIFLKSGRLKTPGTLGACPAEYRDLDEIFNNHTMYTIILTLFHILMKLLLLHITHKFTKKKYSQYQKFFSDPKT